jgi:hypothetical protein
LEAYGVASDRPPGHSVLSWAPMAKGSYPLVLRDTTLGCVVGLSDLRLMRNRLAPASNLTATCKELAATLANPWTRGSVFARYGSACLNKFVLPR